MEREILDEFRLALVADMAALRETLDGTDLGAMARMAHRVKGACRTVGAKALAEVTGRIEDAGRRGDRDAVNAERDTLEREAARLADWLLESVV
jgi:HPt (histidine-containing phosphotransfer) domain-containing protein